MERAYLVDWKVEVLAESSEDAVKKAAEIFKDPNTLATWFQITNLKNGKTMLIDCEKILFPERYTEEEKP